MMSLISTVQLNYIRELRLELGVRVRLRVCCVTVLHITQVLSTRTVLRITSTNINIWTDR